MATLMFSIFYLILSALVGLCAIGRRPGFVITFLLSIIITPFAMLLILYLTKGSHGGEYTHRANDC
jgi:uncharacterized membrane protein